MLFVTGLPERACGPPHSHVTKFGRGLWLDGTRVAEAVPAAPRGGPAPRGGQAAGEVKASWCPSEQPARCPPSISAGTPFPLLPPGRRCGRCLYARLLLQRLVLFPCVQLTRHGFTCSRTLIGNPTTNPAGAFRPSGDRTEQRGISVGTGASRPGRRRQEATPRLLASAHAANTGPFCCPSSATSPAVLCFLSVSPRLHTAPLPAPPRPCRVPLKSPQRPRCARGGDPVSGGPRRGARSADAGVGTLRERIDHVSSDGSPHRTRLRAEPRMKT